MAGDPLVGLGEGVRAGGVHDALALTAQLAEGGEGDHGLSAAGAAGDHDHSLVVRLLSLAHGVQDQLQGIALAVQQDELLALPDLRRRPLQQQAGGREARVLQVVGRLRISLECQTCAEIVAEVGDITAGEQLRVGVGDQVVEIGDGKARVRIVEIDRTVDPLGVILEDRREGGQVAAVVVDLQDRVAPGGAEGTRDIDQLRIVLEGVGSGPLLEFDDDVGRLTRSRVGAGEDGVHPLGGQRELVLQQHGDVPESGGVDRLRQFGDALLHERTSAGDAAPSPSKLACCTMCSARSLGLAKRVVSSAALVRSSGKNVSRQHEMSCDVEACPSGSLSGRSYDFHSTLS